MTTTLDLDFTVVPMAAPGAADPYWSSVVYLSGYEGVDAATTTIDEAKGRTVTANGNAQIDTAQSKFGGASLLLDGATDYLTLAHHTDFDLLTNQFTIEAWVRPGTGFGTVNGDTIIGVEGGTNAEKSWALLRLGTDLFWEHRYAAGSYHTVSAPWTPALNTSWYHVAVDRDATGTIRLYVDGVMLTSAVYNEVIWSGTAPLGIGSYLTTPSRDFHGWLDEVRVTNGVARYASDAGYAVPTAAFPRWGSSSSGLDPRITFSRASLGTYYGSDGLLKYAAHNFALQSQTFDNASWTKGNGATVTADAATAPDGTTTADRLNHVTAGTVVGGMATGINLSVLGSGILCSVYAKSGTKNWIIVAMNTVNNAGQHCFFDLANGVVGTKGANFVSSGISAAGNGWYRCWFLLAAAGLTAFTIKVAEADATATCTSPGDIYIWGAQIEYAFTSTTPSTYLPTTTAAVHGPRFDYDPITHVAKGLLIEEARTNTANYSEDFSNAVWVKTGVTVTANATTAPDGATTADLITTTAATAFIWQNINHGIVNYVVSFFAKKSTSDWIYVQGQATDVPQAWFNLASGTVGTVNAGFLGASIQSIGNGWYRCIIADLGAAGIEPVYVGICDADNSITATVGKAVYLWGASNEGSGATFVSSYIPTAGSAVTRAADVAVMTGSNFSHWYNQPAGTFVAEFIELRPNNPLGSQIVVQADNATTQELISLHEISATATARIVDNNVQQAAISPAGTLLADVVYKLGVSYALNAIAASLNGGAVAVDTGATMPTPTQLRIGSAAAGNYLNGWIRRIQFQNVAVDDATLQTLPQPPTGTTTPVEPQPPAVGPTTTGGAAFWDQEYDGREYESSRKRRKRFLQERERRIAEL